MQLGIHVIINIFFHNVNIYNGNIQNQKILSLPA